MLVTKARRAVRRDRRPRPVPGRRGGRQLAAAGRGSPRPVRGRRRRRVGAEHGHVHRQRRHDRGGRAVATRARRPEPAVARGRARTCSSPSTAERRAPIGSDAWPTRSTRTTSAPTRSRSSPQWFARRARESVPQPDAVALATADADGAPSVRMVLLKGWDDRGFVFFTNYESRKGRELAANPRAALVVYWEPLGRQVRATGRIERTSDAGVRPLLRQPGRGAASWPPTPPTRANRWPIAPRSSRGLRQGRGAVRGEGRAPPRVLGRPSAGPRRRRVLAAPGEPAARSLRLPAVGGRLAPGAPGPLSGTPGCGGNKERILCVK